VRLYARLVFGQVSYLLTPIYMRSILILLSLLTLSPCLRAEQRVIVVTTNSSENRPDLASVSALLMRDWRVIHVSSAGAGVYNTKDFTYIFVLESPSTQSVVAPPRIDLKHIWQSAYNQSQSRGASDSVSRDFADKAVAAVVDAAPEIKP